MDSDLFAHKHGAPADLSADQRLDWLRLIRSRRVGAVTFHRLLAEHGSAAAALAALPRIAAEAGVKDYSVCHQDVALHEMSLARVANARMVCWGEATYPEALYDLTDAPPVLWSMGDLTLLNRPAVAMVGARNASSLGLRMATRLAETLGERGFVEVSG
jgi:DNA processing protein